jgi:hypothetical protein
MKDEGVLGTKMDNRGRTKTAECSGGPGGKRLPKKVRCQGTDIDAIKTDLRAA